MRNRVSPVACVLLASLAALLSSPASDAQGLPAAKALDFESQEEAIVLVAIGEVLDQNPALRPDFAKAQRDIAKAALEVTSVIVFIDEHIDHTAVRSVFKTDPVLATAMERGRLVFFVVPHDTPWIRDYGPQLTAGKKGEFVLVDSHYQDIRRQLEIDRQRKGINDQRRQLITQANKLMTGGLPTDPNVKQAGDAKNAAALATIKDRLFVLQQHDEILAHSDLYDRKNDDKAPYEMMQAATGRAEIKVDRPKLYLDGGNLLRLTDRKLISTKQLLLQNHDKENHLTDQLKQYFHMDEVVYLEPLPGPVIKHVDMFLLPATGKRLLLASYDGMDPKTIVDPHAKELARLASEAMRKNKAMLVDLGYEVIDVPSLPPQVNQQQATGNRLYYPTLLNALTLQTKTGFAVLVPYYPQLDPYVQFEAFKIIRKAFGAEVKIVPVDCSKTAPLQGAIHCLTATVPTRFSIFANGAGTEAKQR